MRQLRPIFAVIAIAALLVACSSTPSASSGDGGGGGASQPEASTGGAGDSVNGGGGGNGGGIFGNGSAKYHITGDHTADGELGFIPAASQIDNGTYSLSFSDEANTLLVIILNADTKALSWTDSGNTIPGATCDFNITRQDSDGAAGTFTCNDQLLFTSAGTTNGNADISGEFDARK